MSRTQIEIWYNQNKEGGENINDDIFVLDARAHQQSMKALHSCFPYMNIISKIKKARVFKIGQPIPCLKNFKLENF